MAEHGESNAYHTTAHASDSGNYSSISETVAPIRNGSCTEISSLGAVMFHCTTATVCVGTVERVLYRNWSIFSHPMALRWSLSFIQKGPIDRAREKASRVLTVVSKNDEHYRRATRPSNTHELELFWRPD